jgi:uncharacterized protein YcaQ
MTYKISNRDARSLWLSTNGLATSPTGPLDTLSIIKQLGFVQLDTIQVVSRAHHHIIWSRNQNYREPMMNKLMAEEREIFEHFTHDASIIPMDYLPMWQRQFRRKKEQLDRSSWYKGMSDKQGRDAIRRRIENEGALSTHAFDTKVAGPKKMWARPPHKLALDYMWYTGELATCHRVNFTKYYDVAERVFPTELHSQNLHDEAQVDWLCMSALERLGVGTLGEIKEFWDAVSAKEVKVWSERVASSLTSVEVQSADGSWISAFAPNDIESRLSVLKTPTSRLRILNPFDPAVRNRKRLARLFGFDYRVEMFVPASKRIWGYYVYPILEGNRFVGRIEVKAERGKAALNVLNVWLEAGVKWTPQRAKKLDAELLRFAQLALCESINWHCPNPSSDR